MLPHTFFGYKIVGEILVNGTQESFKERLSLFSNYGNCFSGRPYYGITGSYLEQQKNIDFPLTVRNSLALVGNS